MELKSRGPSVFGQRAYKHINDFIRIFVKLKEIGEFPLMVDRKMTIEYVAKQIEAEVGARNLAQAPIIDGPNRNSSLADILLQDDNYVTVEIYQLYDAANIAISFAAKVADVLAFDDVVLAITSIEETNVSEFKSEMGSAFVLGDEERRGAQISSLDDRLISVLHNISSLQFFNEFCLQQFSIENLLFWIEVEIYKSILDDNVRRLFSKYLFLTYINRESPLKLNVDEEVRDLLLSQYESAPQKDLFDGVQGFVFLLVKNHAYQRFESSPLFKKFLEFKEQGKVTWDLETVKLKTGNDILSDIEKMIHIMESPDSQEAIDALHFFGNGQFPSIKSAIFRQKVLSTSFSHYFPKSLQIDKGYFDYDSRNQYKVKQMQMVKQRRLKKFFGSQPTAEQMIQQVVSLEKVDCDSSTTGSPIINLAEDSNNELSDRRKKADKLAGFFGNQLPQRQMRGQNLVVTGTDQSSSIIAFHDIDDHPHSNQSALLETINELAPEEKILLTKRAKKLLMLLGENMNGKMVHEALGTLAVNNQVPIDSKPVLNEISSVDVSISDEDGKVNQKQRLDKLSFMMGHRIAESDIAIEGPAVLARPLTLSEKKTFQKKAGKLEQLLGSTIPANSIVHYTTKEDEDLSLEERDDAKELPSQVVLDWNDDENDEDNEKKIRLQKLRKLRKMFGISDVNNLTDQILKDLEHSIQSKIHDPEDRKLLEEDLKKLKQRHSQQILPAN